LPLVPANHGTNPGRQASCGAPRSTAGAPTPLEGQNRSPCDRARGQADRGWSSSLRFPKSKLPIGCDGTRLKCSLQTPLRPRGRRGGWSGAEFQGGHLVAAKPPSPKSFSPLNGGEGLGVAPRISATCPEVPCPYANESPPIACYRSVPMDLCEPGRRKYPRERGPYRAVSRRINAAIAQRVPKSPKRAAKIRRSQANCEVDADVLQGSPLTPCRSTESARDKPGTASAAKATRSNVGFLVTSPASCRRLIVPRAFPSWTTAVLKHASRAARMDHAVGRTRPQKIVRPVRLRPDIWAALPTEHFAAPHERSG